MNVSYQRGHIIPKVFLLVMLLLCLMPGARATEWDVYMSDDGFDPSYQAIQVGDTITWINDDDWGDSHTTTSTQGYWDSGEVPFGYSISLAFPYTGTYPYYDEYTGNTGTIVVNPPPPPPRPILTNPTHLLNGSFQCTVTNLVVGKTFIIQASTNLVNWPGVYTNVAPATSYTYVDNGAVGLPRRFYRALALP